MSLGATEGAQHLTWQQGRRGNCTVPGMENLFQRCLQQRVRAVLHRMLQHMAERQLNPVANRLEAKLAHPEVAMVPDQLAQRLQLEMLPAFRQRGLKLADRLVRVPAVRVTPMLEPPRGGSVLQKFRQKKHIPRVFEHLTITWFDGTRLGRGELKGLGPEPLLLFAHQVPHFFFDAPNLVWLDLMLLGRLGMAQGLTFPPSHERDEHLALQFGNLRYGSEDLEFFGQP